MSANTPPPSHRRWLAVGHASDHDGREAGRRAAAEAVCGPHPRLLVVFASERYDLAALLEGIADAAPGVPLVGCSTAGEIATGGPEDASVVVTALGGEGFSVSTNAAVDVSSRLREAGAEVAASLPAADGLPHRVLLLLTDGLAGDQQEIVRGVYGVVGASIPLVGGCAGDDLQMRSTYQLHGGEVLSNAVVGAMISSDAPFGVGVRHGWRRVGRPVLVTHSEGNRVLGLDDLPALDVYLERLGAPAEAWHDAAAFTRFALTHPLGIERRSGETHARFISEADFEARALVCIAEVPQGGLAWSMEGDDASVLEATDGACDDALSGLGEHAPLGMLAFDCIARRGVLGGDGIRREVARIADRAQGAPVAGFYTYGEIARTHGVAGFHNQTLVVLAIG